jgi:hypothetical protein
MISGGGLVMSASADDLLARLPVPPHGAPNYSFTYRQDTGLAYYAGAVAGSENFLLVSFDLKTFMPVGYLFIRQGWVPQDREFFGISKRLIAVGPAGLATIADGGLGDSAGPVFVFPLSVLKPVPPTLLPPPASASSGIRRFTIPVNGMAAAPGGSRLYFSLPANPPTGNSVVAFDVTSGSFGNPVWVGSNPGALAVSSDGQYLHAILNGPRSLVRLRLSDLGMEQQFHMWQDNDRVLVDVDILLSLPSSPKSVLVGRTDARGGMGGLAIYDDGVQRPYTTHNYPTIGSVTVPDPKKVQLSADGNLMYALAGYNFDAPMTRWRITPNGFEFDASGPLFTTSDELAYFVDLRCQNDLCLTGTGFVVDGRSMRVITRLDYYSADSLPMMDLANNRMFVLSSSLSDTVIDTYDATTHKRISRYVIPNWTGAFAWQKITGDQLAMTNGLELLLVPISQLQSS